MSELKHQILARKKSLDKVSAAELPELGVDIYIRRMSGDEFDRYADAQRGCAKDAEIKGDAAYDRLSYLLLTLTACDENGKLIFEDPKEVASLDRIATERLALRASNFNGLTQAARDEIEKKLKSNGTGTTSLGN